MRLPLSSLPALSAFALVLASSCEPPPPEEKLASLQLNVAKTSAERGTTVDVTFTSLDADGNGGTADVVATLTAVGDGDLAALLFESADVALDAAGLIDVAVGVDSLTRTPGADGTGSFAIGCNIAGKVVLTLVAGELSKTAQLSCKDPVIDLDLKVDPFLNCPTLQADGSSSCQILVEVDQIDPETGASSPAAGQTVTVRVPPDSPELPNPINVVTLDPNLNSGLLTVLSETANGEGQAQLNALTTDVAGRLSFFVVSPAFDLQETVAFVVTTGGKSDTTLVTIKPFLDASSVKIEANPARITSGDTTVLKVTAVDTDGTAADGKTADVTLPAGFVPTASPELLIVGDIVTVSLDANGEGTIDVVAPTVLELEDFTINAEFQAITDSAVRQDAQVVSVDVLGAVTANVAIDRAQIDADGSPQRRAILTLTANQGAQTFDGVTATVRVALNSRAVIKLEQANAGADDGDGDGAAVLVDEDNAAFSAFDAGRATVDIVADSGNSRGLATLEIEMQRDGLIVLSQEVTLIVERDPVLQSIIFVSAVPEIIGVQGSPLQTTSVLTFQLLDDANDPIAGLPVSFVENASDPRVTVDGGLASGADGTITAIVNAGQVSGPVTVTATAAFGGRTLSASSRPIAIVAGVPNSGLSFLLCDAKAQFDPFSASCTLQLADRFTNRVEAALNVQFRAEGGNINAVGTSAAGDASATFAYASPGEGAANVNRIKFTNEAGWSYSQISTVPSADKLVFPGCFDDTTNTPCDLIGICKQPLGSALRAFCPLPPATPGAVPGSCLDGIGVSTLGTFDDQGDFGSDQAINYEIEALTALNSVVADDVDAQVAAYRAEHRRCGFPLSCLQSPNSLAAPEGGLVGADHWGLGLFFDASDDCPVNPGCLDFSDATECPQDGLIDVLASVNGEEGFDDLNGNGVLDVAGVNGATLTEDFVDYPEPFLDKNSSCSFDDLNENARLEPSEKIRLSDLFIDDVDGVFGFDGAETNGVHDLSTELSFKTTIVHISGDRGFQFGELVNNPFSAGKCNLDLGTQENCSAFSGGGARNCVETAKGDVFIPCFPTSALRDGNSASYVFRWVDANGNCPSVDFADVPTVTGTGPITVSANEDVLDTGACGIEPGGIGTANVARPWCEEHRFMGAPLRNVSITVDCSGAEDVQEASLVFTLGGEDRTISFTVTCPTCGDNLREGDEECDNGKQVGCKTCVPDEGFTCNLAQPSVCVADP